MRWKQILPYMQICITFDPWWHCVSLFSQLGDVKQPCTKEWFSATQDTCCIVWVGSLCFLFVSSKWRYRSLAKASLHMNCWRRLLSGSSFSSSFCVLSLMWYVIIIRRCVLWVSIVEFLYVTTSMSSWATCRGRSVTAAINKSREDVLMWPDGILDWLVGWLNKYVLSDDDDPLTTVK